MNVNPFGRECCLVPDGVFVETEEGALAEFRELLPKLDQHHAQPKRDSYDSVDRHASERRLPRHRPIPGAVRRIRTWLDPDRPSGWCAVDAGDQTPVGLQERAELEEAAVIPVYEAPVRPRIDEAHDELIPSA